MGYPATKTGTRVFKKVCLGAFACQECVAWQMRKLAVQPGSSLGPACLGSRVAAAELETFICTCIAVSSWGQAASSGVSVQPMGASCSRPSGGGLTSALGSSSKLPCLLPCVHEVSFPTLTLFMWLSAAILAVAALGAAAESAPRGVTSDVIPKESDPPGCQPDLSGTFTISAMNITAASPVSKPAQAPDGQAGNAAQPQASAPDSSGSSPLHIVGCNTPNTLVLTLSGGRLLDSTGRTGYVAANYQIQFDKPPQAGAIFTGGFSACANGSLALGGSTIFHQCLSGNFYNLYDRSWAAQCVPVYIELVRLIDC